MTELLTDEERATLEFYAAHHGHSPQLAKLLAAYEALVQQVAELTAAHAGALGTLKCANDVSEEWERAYHAEKAAREAAELEAENLRFRLSMAESNNPDSVLSKHNAMLMAAKTADALRARVAELEDKLQREQCLEIEQTAKLAALRAKLERVRVALERFKRQGNTPGCVDDALEALR